METRYDYFQINSNLLGKFLDRPASPVKTQTSTKEKEEDTEKKEKKLFRPVGGGKYWKIIKLKF